MLKKITLGFIVCLLLSFTITNNFSELIQEKLNSYIDNYPEKVYVQTDKPYYSLGEDIWFSTYLVNGINHKKSNKSRVVYVELINEQDSIVSKKQLYMFTPNTAGDFKIEKNWKSGKYILRAYTNYMRNQDPDYFFKKQIPIWDVTNADSIITNITKTKLNLTKNNTLKEKPDINFYPEGGYLVNGIASKIGIKVKDKLNRDIAISGVIKDSDNNVVSSFKTLQFGLGIASLIPQNGKNYTAHVTINNTEHTYQLPKALPEGYNLNIVNNGNHLLIGVTTNNSIGLKNAYLVAHQRGNFVFEKLETTTVKNYVIKLNTNTLNDGVTHFTLFNNEGKPVAERLVYIDNPENNVHIQLTSNKKTPSTREQLSLHVNLKDNNGNAVTGNLSMAVTDIDAIEHSTLQENIKTYLLLNSDLRGQIDNPGYFFENNDNKRKYLLDLVMLTHGWRRFTWNDILYKTTKETIFKPERGLYISGRITSQKNKDIKTGTTRLTFMGAFPHQEKKRVNSAGSFKYGPFVFMDTMPTIVEARVNDFQKEETKANRMVNIHLTPNYSPSPIISRQSVLKPNLNDSTKINNFIKQSKNIYDINLDFIEDARLLDEVIVTATRKTQEEKRTEELNEKAIYGFPTNRIDMKDYENLETLSFLELVSMIPGVNVVNDSITIRGAGSPSIYLNNIPVQIDDVNTMTGAEIEFIDVLKGADAVFFPNSGNGVIVIHQKEGADFLTKNIKRKPGIIDFTSKGFYTAREFYAPNHIDPFGGNNKKDIRTTLHWEPKIQLTQEKSSKEISFYTSDIRSNYAIKIEGVTDDGIPVYHFSTFEVD
ncbi:Plug domain-containing protein [Seonamhaeicola algicola]|uniref:Plug domain-containing protein n=1 Tax=Seonamhaeicola algicola TaxID=1719036 RepID=A0A5C7AJY1_9FLAO|nr:Plug domain-containing protein [Seonamhaeicola algicola]TXE06062.1 Plug domain-containing protein [Seonamhaeicola algicola]